LIIAGLSFLLFLFLFIAPAQGTFGFDAYAFWAVDGTDPYQRAVGGLGSFNYSPPIARLFDSFSALPWYSFLWIWTSLLIGTCIWIGRWSPRVAWVLAFPPVAVELYHGNVHLFMAAAIVIGFRHPWSWSFLALTKVTPAVGLVWFAVRREWRQLGIAAGVTGAIVAGSLVFDFALWVDWLGLLSTTPDGGTVAQTHVPIPLFVRLPLAIALVAWGGRTGRPWTVPLAATLALPILWVSGFAICAALAAPSIWATVPGSRRSVGTRTGS
jgi:hypothetical protein